jgi:hypothetical protein
MNTGNDMAECYDNSHFPSITVIRTSRAIRVPLEFTRTTSSVHSKYVHFTLTEPDCTFVPFVDVELFAHVLGPVVLGSLIVDHFDITQPLKPNLTVVIRFSFEIDAQSFCVPNARFRGSDRAPDRAPASTQSICHESPCLKGKSSI